MNGEALNEVNYSGLINRFLQMLFVSVNYVEGKICPLNFFFSFRFI
jgi:hypothetical protein